MDLKIKNLENKNYENLREFENTKYFGYLFFVKYDGKKFDSFDENPNKRSVKLEFKNLLFKNGIKNFSAIQQAGRTDAFVSAKENVLYLNLKKVLDFSQLKIKKVNGLEIKEIKRTVPFLEFPEMVKKRYYIYEYPEKLIKNDDEKIELICDKVSGKKDFSEFTNKKGKQLKEKIREVLVSYKNKKLYFSGNKFLPQQVRIMSNFILNDKKSALSGKYLTLEKVEFSDEMKKLIFEKVEKFEDLFCKKNYFEKNKFEELEKIQKIEKNTYFTVLFVKNKDKGQFIGKKGKNIKKIKKVVGNVVVKAL